MSAVGVVSLMTLYTLTLALGFASLGSSSRPIADPWFSILEILVVLLMPAMVALMVAVHSWAPVESKALSLVGLVFMALVAGVTSSLHFVILAVGHTAAFQRTPELLSFHWPSVAYALDILAWDFFFALAMLFAAPVFTGGRLARTIRGLMIVSGVLALSGLSGVVTGDMRLRNLGIVGYDGVFLIVAALMGLLFYRTNRSPDRCGARP